MTPNFIWMHVIVGQSGQQPNPHIDFLKKTVFLSLHGLNKVPGKNMQTSQVDSSTLLSWDHGSVFPERSWWYSRKGVLMNSYRIPHRNGPTILWFCVIGVWGCVCVKNPWILLKLQFRYKSLWEEFLDIGHFETGPSFHHIEINVMPLAQIAQPPCLHPLLEKQMMEFKFTNNGWKCVTSKAKLWAPMLHEFGDSGW